MSILADKETKVIVQGITGTQASFHTKRSIDYGTNVVGGVTPGKDRTIHLGVPVFETVKEAKATTGATASIVFVPATNAKSAIKEAIEAELDLVVCISDGIPTRDMLEIKNILRRSNTKLVGPNTPGLITPDEARLGIFPENIHQKGCIGIVSRSSTLTYEAVLETNRAGLGQSTVIGLGDDLIIGIDFVTILEKFIEDDKTKAIVLIGQIGGTFEELGAKWYKEQSSKKPIISFIAGNNLVFGDKVGYAADIITRGKIGADDKKRALKDAGMIVVESINDIHTELKKLNLNP
jgi:succinyl-CoA synthetase alpha subunit